MAAGGGQAQQVQGTGVGGEQLLGPRRLNPELQYPQFEVDREVGHVVLDHSTTFFRADRRAPWPGSHLPAAGGFCSRPEGHEHRRFGPFHDPQRPFREVRVPVRTEPVRSVQLLQTVGHHRQPGRHLDRLGPDDLVQRSSGHRRQLDPPVAVARHRFGGPEVDGCHRVLVERGQRGGPTWSDHFRPPTTRPGPLTQHGPTADPVPDEGRPLVERGGQSGKPPIAPRHDRPHPSRLGFEGSIPPSALDGPGPLGVGVAARPAVHPAEPGHRWHRRSSTRWASASSCRHVDDQSPSRWRLTSTA